MHKLLLTALTPEEIEAIHQATLRILSEIGVILEQSEALKLLLEAGARQAGRRVQIPPELVEWALAQCPRLFSIRGRSGTIVTLGDGALHGHNLGGAREVFDPVSQQVRPATTLDVVEAAPSAGWPGCLHLHHTLFYTSRCPRGVDGVEHVP